MTTKITISQNVDNDHSAKQLLSHLRQIRNVDRAMSSKSLESFSTQNLLKQIQTLSKILSSENLPYEAEALSTVYSISVGPRGYGGLGYTEDIPLSSKEQAEILLLVSAWLESINSAERCKTSSEFLTSRPSGRRGMTMSEKIFAAHDIFQKGEVKPGDMIMVGVDWVMASELSWAGMEQVYNSLGKPGIFRNDRFWLAGDHVVDPRLKNMPEIQRLVAASERARDEFRMTEYQGMNYTIMHTEFCRERAQPGMLVIGSDSHTCSAGSVGALAIGMGVADITVPLITGETWFRIPEAVQIRLINSPAPGIGGKDTILYILKQLKRNTVAADRIVEFTGPGVNELSCDARFAISNMTAEFGGISGIFVPDKVTFDFVTKRKSPRHKKNSNYFRPDADAKYAETHIIDLADVESLVARYPSPDDVVPVSELEGVLLDGCFIGACTTAEEDLIIGAMVLQIGLQKGLVPLPGKRRVVPGSLPIRQRLETLGLIAVYEAAGFDIGEPGCSYCVGMGADRANPGEVWITSQNRNFKNRMGKGAIGHLSSAATVAASSFKMRISDPKPFLNEIDQDLMRTYMNNHPAVELTAGITYVEPARPAALDQFKKTSQASDNNLESTVTSLQTLKDDDYALNASSNNTRKGKIQRLEDFIDTDALAPSEILTSCTTNEEFGEHCLKHTHPNFRARAKNGYSVVVAGLAFGCGSSRENAVSALLGTGVVCVIAKSFAFIYGRNQPNLGLLGIVITDETFYEVANDGVDIVIDLDRRKLYIAQREWSFELSAMEVELLKVGGLTSAFKEFGPKLFDIMSKPLQPSAKKRVERLDANCGNGVAMDW